MFRKLALLSLFAIISTAGVNAQTRKPAAQKPAATKATAPAVTNLKITYKQTTAGQTMESTTMLKGKRERSETRSAYMDSVNITQCDSKRYIQINNKSQKYLITPMETVTASQTATDSTRPASSSTAATRGGVITYTSTAVDTGERKEMYGFTARHIKTSLKIESSPDACNQTQQRMEIDGWYIDLTYGLECDVTQTQSANPYAAQGGCQDRTVFKRTGAARTGYALSETTTMYGPDGSVTFTTTKEVVELSREPLDAALFDIPAGYTEVKDTSELYATPTAATTTPSYSTPSQPETNYSTQPNTNAQTKAAVLRVGVVAINNKAGKPISIESLRDRLVSSIQSSGFEAVPLNAISQTEAEVEAKVKQCDFILFTDISGLKSSTAKKLGGMFGRAVGGSGGGDSTEAKVEFRLFKSGESSPVLQSTATAKGEGEEVTAGAAIDSEAQKVTEALRRR